MPNREIYNQKDWRYFADGYLKVAELIFLELLEQKHEINRFNIRTEYIPGVYNLKHGIEVMLKALSIEFFSKNELSGADLTHNIDQLFSKLHQNISEKRLAEAVDQLEQKLEGSDKFVDEKSVFETLESMVKKYHNLNFLKQYIKEENFTVLDPDNTAMKYPSNSLDIKINYRELSKDFTKENVKQSLFDCIEIRRIMWELFMLIQAEK